MNDGARNNLISNLMTSKLLFFKEKIINMSTIKIKIIYSKKYNNMSDKRKLKMIIMIENY